MFLEANLTVNSKRLVSAPPVGATVDCPQEIKDLTHGPYTLVEFYFRKIMNSEEKEIQSFLCGMFGEKCETSDSKEFQIHSFSTN